MLWTIPSPGAVIPLLATGIAAIAPRRRRG
jgi:hypothetical protein